MTAISITLDRRNASKAGKQLGEIPAIAVHFCLSVERNKLKSQGSQQLAVRIIQNISQIMGKTFKHKPFVPSDTTAPDSSFLPRELLRLPFFQEEANETLLPQ